MADFVNLGHGRFLRKYGYFHVSLKSLVVRVAFRAAPRAMRVSTTNARLATSLR